MKKFGVIILAIFLLLNSCAPVSMVAFSAGDSFGQLTAATEAAQAAATPVEMQSSHEFSSIQKQEYSRGDLESVSLENSFNSTFLAPGAKWTEFVGGEAPATFSPSKISYTLADDVIKVDSNITKNIASAGQLIAGSTIQKQSPNKIIANGGYIRQNILDAAAAQAGAVIENGSVLVDESTGTAFKVVSPTIFTGAFETDTELKDMTTALQGTYGLATPQLHEVIKDFSLEEDTIRLTRGNISGFAPNIEDNLYIPDSDLPENASFNPDSGFNLDETAGFKYISNDSLLALKFDHVALGADLGNTKISVTVTGGLGIDDIQLTGRYSSFGGYKITLALKQESYLMVELDVEVHEEIRIPILSIDIPFIVGRVSGGLYAIVGMDGNLRLEIVVREWTPLEVGVQGGTAFCIPTSVRPIFNQDIKCDGNVQLSGKINGYLKFGPMVSIEIFGIDLVGTGVLLGAGATVELDGTYLDVTLYGILNIYVQFLGKTYNLVNFRPTILNRRQTDTAGLIVKYLEVFVDPSRVGGTIQREPDKPGGSFEPVAGVQYRVWVVPPEMKDFDLNNSGHLNDPRIGKYPKNGYALTNEWGEFYQDTSGVNPGDVKLRNGSRALIEFKWQGQTYYSNPIEPTLPFDKVTINHADYYNHYVIGQVQPKRVLNWLDGIPEQTYQLAYYNNKAVFVQPYIDRLGFDYQYGGHTGTQTDEKGYFDTRIPLDSPIYVDGTLYFNDSTFEIPGNYLPWETKNGFDLTLLDEGVRNNTRVEFKSTMSLSFSRVLEEVEGSYERYEEDGKLIDRMQYDEHIWIINNHGTRTPTDEEFRYYMKAFSTQDYSLIEQSGTEYEKFKGGINYYHGPDPLGFQRDSSGIGTRKLTPILDENGNPTGTALFSQRVTVEWVWQPHPNPVKITSPDHTIVDTQGGTFFVTAEGYAPFKYILIGAPPGVKILWGQGLNDGMMTIPAGLSPGDYSFTIRAEENRGIFINPVEDPYEGNDPSPPDEQIFFLKVKAPPVIAQEAHGYKFETSVGEKMSVNIVATGSGPIAWSIIPTGSNPVHKSISIDSRSGVLYMASDIEGGMHYFTIKAENDMGSDTQKCSLRVVDPTRTAPEIHQETHGYAFEMTKSGDKDLFIPVSADGSKPISWSLTLSGKNPQEGAITIDPESGVLRFSSHIYPGAHYFTIKATNDLGSDTQECSIQVTDPSRTAPLIVAEEHGYAFEMTAGGKGLSIPVSAAGSTPISWTLVPTGSNPVPEGVFIASETGILTIGSGVGIGTHYFTIKATNDVGSDTQECSLSVISPRTAPEIAQEAHGYAFEMTVGEGALSIPVTATGSAPISWSIIPTGSHYLSQYISIGAESGVLLVGSGISDGTHYFTIKAENDVGSDTQECILRVTDPRTPPKITSGGSFIKYLTGEITSVQMNATGTTPIYWSVEPSAGNPMPPVWIEETTGVLYFGADLSAGMHYFTVKATNAVGSDSLSCSLEAKIFFMIDGSAGTRGSELADISISTSSSATIESKSAASASSCSGAGMLRSLDFWEVEIEPITIVQEFSELGEPWNDMYYNPGTFTIDKSKFERVPPNAVTIRWDDPRDVYTDDRWTINGAMFVRWSSYPGVGVGPPDYYGHYGVYYYYGGIGGWFTDHSPRCDNYHYDPETYPDKLAAERMKKNLLNALAGLQSDYNSNESVTIEWTRNFGITQGLDLYPGGRRVGRVTYLDSRPLVEEISGQKGGSFELKLDEYTGTIIQGNYFVALQGNKSANLSFIQDGATIIFAGKDIEAAYELTLFNFGYCADAFHRDEMLAAAGSEGINFCFSFAHHGKLPGMAEFNIATDIAAGTKVNVYKFDPETGSFALIAGNVRVGEGGTVRYRNNTMSEYLVTTKTLEDAEISEIADQQSSDGGDTLLFIGIAIALLIGAAAFIVARQRKRQGASQ